MKCSTECMIKVAYVWLSFGLPLLTFIVLHINLTEPLANRMDIDTMTIGLGFFAISMIVVCIVHFVFMKLVDFLADDKQ